MKKNRKRLVTLVIVLTMVLSLFSVAYSSGTYQTIKAWFGDIKIVANGKQITSNLKPFVVNETTYVPLRVLAESLDKVVGWNGNTYTVTITDKPDQANALLWQQMFSKDAKIAELEKKVELLESQVKRKKVTDLDDLEDDLMYYYGKYEDIKFSIDLYGDEDDIEVRIYVDLYDYEDEWDDLRQSDIEDYLQDIVDDILEEFEDADITGFIKDDDSRDKLLEFTVSYKGNVNVSYEYDSDLDLDDLEDDLMYYYDKYEGIKFDIDLYGDEDDIEVRIYVDLYDYEDEWDDLRQSDIEDYLQDIVDDILGEFRNAYIDGYIKDSDSGDKLLSFYVRSNKTVVVK